MPDVADAYATRTSPERPGAATATIRGHSALRRLVYRSRATLPLSGEPLAAMLQAARHRNHRMGVTGLLVADGKRYLQWLEGPSDGVRTLMHSISLDRRHDSIEVLAETPVDARTFKGWDMRLASDSVSLSGALPSLEIPAPLVDSLWAQSTDMPDLMATLGVDPAATRRAEPHGAAPTMIGDLRMARESGLREARRPFPVPQAELDRLIGSLLDGRSRIDHMLRPDVPVSRPSDVRKTFVTLIEPVARRLGDLWQQNDLAEFDVTIALGRLHVLIHHLAQSEGWVRPRPAAPRVLVASVPGEPHSLSAVLDAESLWMAGWMPAFDVPPTDAALEQRLRDERFDLLDLSLSPVFERRDRLGDLRRRLTGFRAASRNPGLCIRLAGRVFPEHQLLAGLVGADVVARSCHRVDRQLARLLPGRADA